MYKFNYLMTINKEKIQESQRTRVVTLVFILSLFVSLLFLGLLYFNTSNLYTKNEKLIKREKLLKEKLKSFRKGKTYFNHKKVSNVYETQKNRIIWTDVFYDMEILLGETAIIEEVHYNFDKLIVRYKLKAEASKTKGDIMGLLNSYKDTLSNSVIFKKYLEEDVEISDGPNKGIKTKIKDIPAFMWEFELIMELKPILRFNTKGKRKKTRKSRFN